MRKAICWLLWMSLAGWAWGQQASSNPGAVPTVIRFSGSLADADGKPLTGMEGVTFSLYTDQQGGAPLWVETQNVQADKSGHYSVTLGSTSSQGLPQAIFTSGEARWLGVQGQAQAEQPRVLLMSVPYALKAGDAETVGGLPPSAFMKASSANGTGTNTTSNLPPVTGGGKPGFIASWKTATQLTSSKLFQSAAGNIGVGTAKPAGNLDVNGTAIVRNTLTLFPNGSAPTLTVNGTAFNVSNTGLVSFVSGQTFPGTGTITGVTTASGSGLTGGGTSGNLNLALTNTCASNQVLQWSGSLWVCSNAGAGTITGVFGGTDLTGQGTSGNVTLNLDITKVPQLGTANIFGGTQTVGSGDLAINVGNLDLPQTGGGNVGVITLGGAFFIHACCANSAGNTSVGIQAGAFNGATARNTALGYQALTSDNGTDNTANGYQALLSNGQGNFNTAVGSGALMQNTTGTYNTGIGTGAGSTNTTAGSHNTLIGASADVGSDGLTNATAIGANAQVTTNNALVLGSIAGVNKATASANVGIGTTAPASTLDVHGTGNFTGLITFAPNQTFPGTGTISGVSTAAGSGLTGGGTSGTLNLGLTNSCSSGQVLTWSGSGWVCTGLSGGGTITGVMHGTYLTGGGTSGNVTLDLDTTKVPLLNTANSFTGNQTVTGSVTATGTVSGGVVNSSSSFNLGGAPFAFGSSSTQNAFLGFSGNSTMTGNDNTASGFAALQNNLTGGGNTASGFAALQNNTSGGGNTGSGYLALYFNSTGFYNTASGFQALYKSSGSSNTASGAFALYSSTTGILDTASGTNSLYSNTTGSYNTASGFNALFSNTTGQYNTATGYGALQSNTSSNNTASGGQALYSNTTGGNNTASGFSALYSNTTGSYNTATGYGALQSNTSDDNTATGYQALQSNTTACCNTANGFWALVNNTAYYNTATGYSALQFTTTGRANTANGVQALVNNTTGQYNTATGSNALQSNTTGAGNTALGYGADVGSGNLINATAIGANAVVSESNALVLGGTGSNAVKIGIGTATPSNVFTIVQGAGHGIADGWDTYSSRRWKTNIQTLHGALAKVEQLRGVSYDLKDSGKHEVGVIAEEVGAVVPEIVSWEKNGKDAQGVDYSRLPALLIEATKEQQTLIDKQQQRINKQQAQIASQRAAIGRLRNSDAQQAHALQTVAAQMTLLQSKLAQLEGNVSDLRPARKAAAAGANGRQVAVAIAPSVRP